MGYIYKITNKLNNKVYIGQTIKDYKKRWNQHKNNSNKPYFSQIALYKAFNKYGIDNFDFEVIEEVDNTQLDKQEKYWIKQYNSFYNGYNSTLGGRTTQLYEWNIDDIVEQYMTLKSARKVAEKIGCDHSTIDRILNENNIYRFSIAEQRERAVKIVKPNQEVIIFPTVTEAALWFIDNKYTSSTNISNVRRMIQERIIKRKPYFGFELSYT